ncbi:hypothetical protein FisN_1Lh632 [Fistulifera solaris]|uniref:Conserved oligomeric Golgi complex subunit 1 n=1 Tax=Fistulifera solaris TaxID=1519565 RepID=A0A1Z5K1K2_FISSO|nr:hypothetical protein FisN_1Lh632 [Fistulifera solaris]|eukprot:GAX19901.1 hypothetical protein FisN_1Lh632 [Fistulifera solaris]
MININRTTSVDSAGSSSSPRSTRAPALSVRGSASGGLRGISRPGQSLPPPPTLATQNLQNSQYSQAIAKTMTIDEMRMLHDRALREAEAKRTELRLVLASRYRELVGSSDEVIIMNERAQELYDLVHGLPSLFDKLVTISNASANENVEEQKDQIQDDEMILSQAKRDLFKLPRMIHRALDKNDALKATTTLIDLFSLIASCSESYPLANSLADPQKRKVFNKVDSSLIDRAQMVFLHVQSLPQKIKRTAIENLLSAASFGKRGSDPADGVYESAASLVSHDLLDTEKSKDRASRLLDIYFDSKTKLLVSLLNKLQSPQKEKNEEAEAEPEHILAKIVLVLQYDALLHPYQIFVLKKFHSKDQSVVERVAPSLPVFDKAVVKSKCSAFMATHLPLIRKKVKTVLVSIAGTSASALGHIRQSLYDKTDGLHSMERLSSHGLCSWEEAVENMVDVHTVLGNAVDISNQRFSLWNALFSHTFSSLVHSLLTTSFQSVHSRVVATLTKSLSSAPPASSILPHEAYRNTLQLTMDLNQSLMKVSDDAHELLVHAEERVESERRLRESLYVQTCEILGRLVSELRRLVQSSSDEANSGTKEFIVGRLCYLLKYRLSALPKLLDPNSSPAAMQSTIGMISYVDIQTAFDVSDDDEDGVVTFDEALQAVESAFSGTAFHGAEMVRETLLLTPKDDQVVDMPESPKDVTLDELVLLTARGIRHEATGTESALGAFQRSLDKIIGVCFAKWARASLQSGTSYFRHKTDEVFRTGPGMKEEEWKRIYGPADGDARESANTILHSISPHLAGLFIAASTLLNCNTCPADSFEPAPTVEYATKLGLRTTSVSSIPTLLQTLRSAILNESMNVFIHSIRMGFEYIEKEGKALDDFCPSSIVQLRVDVGFVSLCYNGARKELPADQKLEHLRQAIEVVIGKVCRPDFVRALASRIEEEHSRVLDSSDIFFASLFGQTDARVSSIGEIVTAPSTRSDPLIYMPLESSCRYALLPVPADRTLNEIQLRGKYVKDREQTEKTQDANKTNVVSSGFGFLSSMLKNR